MAVIDIPGGRVTIDVAVDLFATTLDAREWLEDLVVLAQRAPKPRDGESPACPHCGGRYHTERGMSRHLVICTARILEQAGTR